MGFLEWASETSARWFTQARNSVSVRTLLAVVLSSGVTAAALLSVQASQRKIHRKQLRDSVESHFPRSSSTSRRPSIRDLDEQDEEMQDFSDLQKTKAYLSAVEEEAQGNARGKRKRTRVVDEEIINEQLARNIAFLGQEAQNKIRNSFVIVVGVGGVGSAAATILVRSGVGKIRLIDFDQVSLSSLNRHSVATLADVGTPKVLACQAQYEAIAPWVEVDARVELFSLGDADTLLEGHPDWVIDCIDNIQTKVELLSYCRKKGIKVFSAMGAGGKSDPSRIQISDISLTFEDPLARSVRQKLKREGIFSGIPVVYSTEKPGELGKLLPLPEEEFQKGAVHELSALEAFRVRILPVLGPLPCMFGQAAAAYLIAELAGNVNMQPLAVKNRHKMYHKLVQDLYARELRNSGINKVPISEDDAAYIFEELHRGRSVVAPNFTVCTRPVLVKWERDGPVNWNNLVVMEREEASKHEKECLLGGKQPEEVWNAETVELVAKRKRLEEESRDYRLL